MIFEIYTPKWIINLWLSIAIVIKFTSSIKFASFLIL